MRTTAVNRASLLAIAIVLGGAAGCSERTLLQVDVTGDRRFEGVVLRLTVSAAETSAPLREADFPNAGFDTTDASAYKAGLYLPAGWSGAITVAAKVIDGACEVAGSEMPSDVEADELSAVVRIRVVSHASCIPIGDGSAGGSGGGAGAAGTGGSGGSTGAGGAAGGAAGAGGTGGAGGAAGSGGGSGTGGASGGRSGAGGAAGTAGGTAGAGGRAGTGGAAGAGGRAGTGGAAGTGGGIAGASGMGGGATGGVGGTVSGTGGAVGGTGGTVGAAGRGGTGGAGGCSQSNADACGIRNCGSAQNSCGQVVPCGICRDDQCCDLGVCNPAGNPPRC